MTGVLQSVLVDVSRLDPVTIGRGGGGARDRRGGRGVPAGASSERGRPDGGVASRLNDANGVRVIIVIPTPRRWNDE